MCTGMRLAETPAAQVATRKVVAMQEIVPPPETEQAAGVIVFVFEQMSVPVVLDQLVVFSSR
jgi:hypothetical protein